MNIKTHRLNAFELIPDGVKSMMAPETYLATSPVDAALRELVKIRASQINGCVFCIDVHTRTAMASGESMQRIMLLDAWREADLYRDSERAALAWTEALTRIETERAPESTYAVLEAHFTSREIADLTMAIAHINAWNRLATGLGFGNQRDISQFVEAAQ